MAGPAAGDDAEARAALTLRLRRGGVRDLGVLRAFETVPRHLFVPEAHAALASRDIALPIGCGQTTLAPSTLARTLEALGCRAGNRVLEIGGGSGFVTALLAQTAGQVTSLERFRTLAAEATRRLRRLGLRAARVAWADGLAATETGETVDRILVHAAIGGPPPAWRRLAPDGVLVYPRLDGGGATLVRAVRRGEGLDEQRIGPSPLAPAIPGRSAVL